MARTDFPSRTSMQETRLIAGDRKLFAKFRRVLRDNVYRHDFEQFLMTTLGKRDQRYRKYGASPYIGEPNVKESAGGLRDVHTAMWLGAAKFGARTLREICRQAHRHGTEETERNRRHRQQQRLLRRHVQASRASVAGFSRPPLPISS